MTNPFRGTPSIIAATVNTQTITYTTPPRVGPKVFGLTSFDTVYITQGLNSFDMSFVEGGIVVSFTRAGANFTSVTVTKGQASTSYEAETATVTIALSDVGVSYNIFSYRIVISQEEGLDTYNTFLLLPGTAVTRYTAVIDSIPLTSENIAQNRFAVEGNPKRNIYFLAQFFDQTQYQLVFSEALIQNSVDFFAGATMLLCTNEAIDTLLYPERVNSTKISTQVSSPGVVIATFSITAPDKSYVSNYSFVISNGASCPIKIFTTPLYTETRTLFPTNRNLFFASAPVAEPVPPYLFIDAELTNDLKNISVFRVRAASSTWACEWTLYALPFASVLRGEGCTLADRVESLFRSGLPVFKNLMAEYMLLRISLSGILGVSPFCCFSVDLLRQRYWLPFRKALAASEFRAALAFFDEPQYNLVGYERFFKK